MPSLPHFLPPAPQLKARPGRARTWGREVGHIIVSASSSCSSNGVGGRDKAKKKEVFDLHTKAMPASFQGLSGMVL